jgi:formylglycine-generating enzyme required for sulfatase activity
MKRLCLFIITAFITCTIFAQTKNVYLNQPGQTFRDCKDCPEMVVIPAGSFTMGSPENEQGRYPEEGPQRKISIKQFAAGKFDITKKEWAAFVKSTNRQTKGGCSWSGLPQDSTKNLWDPNPKASWRNLGFQQDDSHPVVCVTWDDAQDYVRWLSQKTGAHYCLLTEAEWEYAARAGTSTAYPWGDSASHGYANYGTDTTAGVGFASGRDKWVATSPVGSFPPNQFGLYDMHGNVLQWVQDCFSPSYSGLPTDGSAYKADVPLKMEEDILSWMNGKSSCSFHICRGGDAWDPPSLIRSASRNWGPPEGGTIHNYASAGLGFRVARTL